MIRLLCIEQRSDHTGIESCLIFMKKIYILDTNILIQSPSALYGFADNDIYLTTTITQELDKHKTDAGEVGFNAREVIRVLDDMRRNFAKKHERGEFGGMALPNGGTLYVMPDTERNHLPKGCSLEVPDNRIINTVMELTETSDKQVILVTNDTSMRFNAFGMSKNKISIQEYKNETIETDEVYTGKADIQLPKELIDLVASEETMAYERIPEHCRPDQLYENEFLHLTALENPQQSVLAIYRKGNIHVIKNKYLRGFCGIRGKNMSQNCLMYALLAPAEEIPLVIAKGPAGTGKTILSVACGLDKTYRAESGHGSEYTELLMTRANVLLDNDMGYLPGDLDEKMSPLIAPFLDNMENIFGGNGKDKDIDTARQQINYVRERGIADICPIGYIRGRTLTNRFLIVDEAQNLTVSQALAIITRAGEGTKIVLLGDPDQVDAKYLDRRNNGLVFASEKMKGSEYCCQITFEQQESVRSPLAMEAAKRLTIGN